ncbi:MAG: hypothetical protein HY860_06935 [Chlamydiales bacterium]|nr:hypothetical protein [Chlamydiales bacterium]
MKHIFLYLLIVIAVPTFSMDFDKVVIWGHKLHSHTHSYIHNAFYKAFKSLGYATYWVDEHDDVSKIDFSHSLFLTEGQVDNNIPLRDDSFYILHNCTSHKYRQIIKNKRFITLQVYTDDVLTRPTAIRVSPCIHYDYAGRCLYMPWATDLLPSEIEAIQQNITKITKQPMIAWIGTISDGEFGNISELMPFVEEARKLGMTFIRKQHISDKENKNIIAHSLLAPAIVGKWQKEKGYIPCRIFKNISYGGLGITNSLRVCELFNNNIIYDPDPRVLFKKAYHAARALDHDTLESQMEFVKAHHTYINRINTILEFIDQLDERNVLDN